MASAPLHHTHTISWRAEAERDEETQHPKTVAGAPFRDETEREETQTNAASYNHGRCAIFVEGRKRTCEVLKLWQVQRYVEGWNRTREGPSQCKW